RAARPSCPNCGRSDFDRAETVDRSGDRLLVQKYVFDWFSPRRWEVAVFQNPNDPSQAYVKRVVGLPGESIRIAGGDVYVNGRIARKSLAEQRAMRILVYDNNFSPPDAEHRPRWLGRPGGGWRPRSTGFLWEPAGRGDDGID